MTLIVIEIDSRKARKVTPRWRLRRRLRINNASLDAYGNRMELHSKRIILKFLVREAILFRRSRIKRSVVRKNFAPLWVASREPIPKIHLKKQSFSL